MLVASPPLLLWSSSLFSFAPRIRHLTLCPTSRRVSAPISSAKAKRSTDTEPPLQAQREDYRRLRLRELPKKDQARSLSCPRSRLHWSTKKGPAGMGRAVMQSPECMLSTWGDGNSPMTEGDRLRKRSFHSGGDEFRSSSTTSFPKDCSHPVKCNQPAANKQP